MNLLLPPPSPLPLCSFTFVLPFASFASFEEEIEIKYKTKHIKTKATAQQFEMNEQRQSTSMSSSSSPVHRNGCTSAVTQCRVSHSPQKSWTKPLICWLSEWVSECCWVDRGKWIAKCRDHQTIIINIMKIQRTSCATMKKLCLHRSHSRKSATGTATKQKQWIIWELPIDGRVNPLITRHFAAFNHRRSMVDDYYHLYHLFIIVKCNPVECVDSHVSTWAANVCVWRRGSRKKSTQHTCCVPLTNRQCTHTRASGTRTLAHLHGTRDSYTHSKMSHSRSGARAQ